MVFTTSSRSDHLLPELTMTNAIYFDVLQYSQRNLALLERSFSLTRLADPSQCTDEILEKAEVVFAPLGYSFGDPFLQRCPKLRVIATNTTGVPHIDVEAARKRRVTVVSLADERDFLQSITPTAELALGLIIAITRNVLPAAEAVKKGQWRRWDFGGAAMLSRMSLGIVGFGRLGSMLGKYAAGLGMKISCFDPLLENRTLAAAGVLAVDSLEQLVEKVDVVSVHVHLNPSTRGMFNEQVFSHFREGSYFVNTSRGEIVDDGALVRALESGRLAGAALDVLSGEFDPGFQSQAREHTLIRYAVEHSNLLITPHIGGSTQDAWSLTQAHTIHKAIVASNPRELGATR